jgi:3'(2'), 5'-bisphosphate nucleotidase
MAAGHVPELKGRPFWLVDPLGRHKEFIKRNGEFHGRTSPDRGRPRRSGIVLAPVPDTLWRGDAARRRQERERRRLHAITTRTPPADGLTAFASRSTRSTATSTSGSATTASPSPSASRPARR